MNNNDRFSPALMTMKLDKVQVGIRHLNHLESAIDSSMKVTGPTS
jgi:hypothetical protein